MPIGKGQSQAIGTGAPAGDTGPAPKSADIRNDPSRILQTLAPGKMAVFRSPLGTFGVEPAGQGTYRFLNLSWKRTPVPEAGEYPLQDMVNILQSRDVNASFVTQESKNMSKDLVKMELLRRKINEHFTKNPDSKSVIIKANLDEGKTAWKVTRTKKGLSIVEVATKRKKYLIEAPVGGSGQLGPGGAMPVGGQRPGSTTQVPGQMSTQLLQDPFYLDLIAQPSSEKMAELVSKNLGRISEPIIKVIFATLMRESPALGKLLSNRKVVQLLAKMGGQIQASYKPVTEAPEDPEKKKNDDEDKLTKKKPGEEDPTGPIPKEPQTQPDPEQDAGLETNVDASPDAQVAPEMEPATAGPEQAQLTNRVKGQVVKDMIVEPSQDGLNLSIDFATLNNNLDIEYRKSDGRTVWKLGELGNVIKPGVKGKDEA
jgi:hypothetical protein